MEAIDKRPARLFSQNVREARDAEREKLKEYRVMRYSPLSSGTAPDPETSSGPNSDDYLSECDASAPEFTLWWQL